MSQTSYYNLNKWLSAGADKLKDFVAGDTKNALGYHNSIEGHDVLVVREGQETAVYMDGACIDKSTREYKLVGMKRHATTVVLRKLGIRGNQQPALNVTAAQLPTPKEYATTKKINSDTHAPVKPRRQLTIRVVGTPDDVDTVARDIERTLLDFSGGGFYHGMVMFVNKEDV